MAKKKQNTEETMIVGKFELVNKAKVERAIASVGNDEQAILVEYDKLGGLIRHEGNKVVNGSFFDRRTGKAVEDPKPRVIKRQKAVIEEEIEEVELEDAPKKGKEKKVEEVVE